MNVARTLSYEVGALPMPSAIPIVFIVDDDVSVCESLELLVRDENWKPETFASAQEFLDHPRKRVPSCLILDLSLPGLNGLELQKLLAVEHIDMPIIFITGHGDVPQSVQAIKAGALEFLTKPVNNGALVSAIRNALQRSSLAHELLLEAGFRHFDCAERYRNEREVSSALQAGASAGGIAREDIFVTTKLWNSNHRPERVEPAFEASLDRLALEYLDLYLIHTPFAFQPGDEQDPRDQNGNVIYDRGVTLLDTWRALESLVDHGKYRAIGLSDVGLNELKSIYDSARIKPAVVQVEAHPYLPETELLEFCKEKGVVFLAFAPLGHGMKPGLLEDPVVAAIAARIGKTPAQVLLAWAVQRGTALLTTPRSEDRARENFDISALPQDSLDEINRIQIRQRLNPVVSTGIPGFIPKKDERGS
jgi:alcohol dehydrogenase (NADP+)